MKQKGEESLPSGKQQKTKKEKDPIKKKQTKTTNHRYILTNEQERRFERLPQGKPKSSSPETDTEKRRIPIYNIQNETNKNECLKVYLIKRSYEAQGLATQTEREREKTFVLKTGE